MLSFDEAWHAVDGINRLQDRDELEWLFGRVRAAGVQSLLEIGSRRGASLYVLTHAMPKGSEAFAIDLPNGPWGDPQSAGYLHRTAARLWDEGYRVHLRMESSQQADLGTRRFGVVFIDGDHSYRGVSSDWTRWGRFATRFCAFHDIAVPDFEVRDFWSELASTHRTEQIVRTLGIGLVETHHYG